MGCSDAYIETIELQIAIADDQKTSTKPDWQQDEHGMYGFSHAFKMKGKYDTHLLINGEYVATYVVTVRK